MIIIDKIGARGGMDGYNLAFGEALASFFDVIIACSNSTVITNHFLQKNLYSNILHESCGVLLNLFYNIIGLYKVLRLKCSDSFIVLHVFNFDFILFLDVLIFRIFRKKIILVVHDYESITGRKNYSSLKSYCIKNAKHIFVHNPELIDKIEKDFSVKAHQFNHGIVKPSLELTPSEFDYLKINQDFPNILFFGMIKRVKGFDVLTEALRQIKSIKCNLIVAGRVDREYVASFNEIVEAEIGHNLQLFNRFITNEERDYFFKTADLIIIPYRESFQSGVLLMSLAYGKPTICNDLPAFSPFFKALPFLPKYKLNDPSALASSIEAELHSSSFNDINLSIIEDYLKDNYFWPGLVSEIYNNVLSKESINVSVIGTVGLPACYGGFESLVENLVEDSNFSYSVYCQASQYSKKLSHYKSASLIYLPINANGIQSIFYDILSIVHSLMRTKNTLLILGVSGTVILPLLRLFSDRRIITNIDGLEWKRKKWGKIASWFLKISEGFAVRHSNVIVSDNKAISDYLKNEYRCDPYTIPYGGDHSVISDLPIEKDNFFLGLCRIEPENNVDMILESFSINGEQLKFIGNWSNSAYSRRLRQKYNKFTNIELIDPIYDVEELFIYRSKCKGYIHGHSAGGTNPSLVEMMHFNTSIFCFDCSYNRESTENNAFYFANKNQLTDHILNLRVSNGGIMRDIASRRYTWEIVKRQYEDLF